MDTMNVKEARAKFAKLINAAQRGRSIAITRRGKPVARLAPPAPSGQKRLPDLSAFREAIKLRGKSISHTVRAQRQSDRY